jgi:hypothetical protein
MRYVVAATAAGESINRLLLLTCGFVLVVVVLFAAMVCFPRWCVSLCVFTVFSALVRFPVCFHCL